MPLYRVSKNDSLTVAVDRRGGKPKLVTLGPGETVRLTREQAANIRSGSNPSVIQEVGGRPVAPPPPRAAPPGLYRVRIEKAADGETVILRDRTNRPLYDRR